MDYKKEYLKFKIKYVKLKKKIAGLYPDTLDLFLTRPITRQYESLYIYNCAYLPNYSHKYVNLKYEKEIPDDILEKIEKYHQENNYQLEGFNNIKNLIDTSNNLKVPNNTVFTYVLFPTDENIKEFGFETGIDIRFHRVDSAFELHSKHDYIIEKIAGKKDKSSQKVYCGGEFKIYKDNKNQIILKINRKSGTIPNCWEKNAKEVNVLKLFESKTGIKTEKTINSMIDKTKTNYEQFFEDYEYLKKLTDFGLELDFYEKCPSQWDEKEPIPITIDQINYKPERVNTNKTPEKKIITSGQYRKKRRINFNEIPEIKIVDIL